MRRTIILAAAFSIIVLGFWGTIVIYFDQTRLRSIFSDRLSEEFGRRVDIAGAVEFSFFPSPSLTLADVLVASSGGPDGLALTAEKIGMTLRVFPLLRGELAPGRMDLQGALIDLTRTASAGGAGASLLSAVTLLEGRSLQLRDVTVRLGGAGDVNDIVIDAIDVDQFRLDETVSLRFRGDIGRPAVVAAATLSAKLLVPSDEAGLARLRDVELNGHLVPVNQALSLTGDLAFRQRPAARVTLSGGRFRVGDSSFDVSLDYRGGASPALDLLASGEGLPPPLPAVMGRMALSAAPANRLAAWSTRTNIRAQLQLERLRLPVLALSDLRLDLRSASGGLAVEVVAGAPGGVVEASGLISGESTQHIDVELSLAEASSLFDQAGIPPAVGGTGEGRARLSWPSVEGAAFSVEGMLSLWDGFWRVALGDSDPESLEFTTLSTQFRYTPGYLAIPEFVLTGNRLEGEGWAAAEFPDGTLAGEFFMGPAEAAPLKVGGRLGQPRLLVEGSVSEGAEGTTESDGP